MQGRMLLVLGAMSALLLSAPAVAVGAPKPREPKAVTVDNPFVTCAMPEPSVRVEYGLGSTVQLAADRMIDFVEVKAGNGGLVSSSFGLFTGEVTMSKNVGWYVVWGCQFGGGGGGGEV